MSEKLHKESLAPDQLSAADDILAISADAIISIDASQRITRFNRGAEEIFGYAADEALGQRIEMLIPERFRERHQQQVEQFGRGPVVARRMGERGQISGLRKSGEEFPAEASISRTNAGGSLMYTVVLRDVTERARLYAEAQAAVRARDDVLAVVSHDLGNPLASIRLGATVLLRSIQDEELRRQAENIRTAVDQMQRLIQDLLEIKRIESGYLSLERERLSASALLAQAMEANRDITGDRQLALSNHGAADDAAVFADRERIAQVFANLIGNAAKFTPAGGTIEMAASSSDERVVFSVHDNGQGIPAEHLPFVFDRFWQARRTGRHGVGLGLAIVKGIVEAHGGSVWVESEPGAGSTFYFQLPRIASD
jgi:PAS domain S-box-containing protein